MHRSITPFLQHFIPSPLVLFCYVLILDILILGWQVVAMLGQSSAIQLIQMSRTLRGTARSQLFPMEVGPDSRGLPGVCTGVRPMIAALKSLYRPKNLAWAPVTNSAGAVRPVVWCRP